MARAVWNGVVLAESDRCEMVEGNHYFPPDAVNREYLKPSDTHTVCAWKGTASYFHVEAGGQRNPDAAWYYPEPRAAARNIKDHVAFWKGVTVQPSPTLPGRTKCVHNALQRMGGAILEGPGSSAIGP